MFAGLETLLYVFSYNFRKEQREYVLIIVYFTYLVFILVFSNGLSLVTGRPM